MPRNGEDYILGSRANFASPILPRFAKREGLGTLIPRDIGSSGGEGSVAIESFGEKKPASAISPLVVSHVRRAAQPFVFVHFAHPVSEKMPARLFVTKPKPQITPLHLRVSSYSRILPRARFARYPRVYLNAITTSDRPVIPPKRASPRD